MRHAGAVGHGHGPPVQVVPYAPSFTAGLCSSGCVPVVSGMGHSGVLGCACMVCGSL